jgi:hypothetical protein
MSRVAVINLLSYQYFTTERCNPTEKELFSKFCPTNISQTFTMDSSLSCASIEAVVKRVETFGGGGWGQELFC